MDIKLVVVRPFADYNKGDEITDQSKVVELLASHNAPNVVKVAKRPTLN